MSGTDLTERWIEYFTDANLKQKIDALLAQEQKALP